MRRGELYRARNPHGDPRATRVYLIVSRDGFLAARYSSALAVPIYSNAHGLSTEVTLGPNEGLKHPSVARCDEITSVYRSALTDFVGVAGEERMHEVNRALADALAIDLTDLQDASGPE